MELKHIDIACLSVSPANMRGVKKAPDLTNILPSVRARGILVPLIVRQNGSPATYEIVAGKRRYHAAMVVAQEEGSVEPLPCAVMEAGDDAAALEASLIENIARLDALGHVGNSVLYVEMRGRPTAALTQRAGGGRPVRRIAQRCLIAA